MGWLEMRDFLTLEVKGTENKKYLFECTDSKSPTGKSLSVRAAATHSGIVNGNAKFYRPDRMQDSTSTWTPKGRPARPVLIQHNKTGDCIGRVVKAHYVDTSYKYCNDFPGVKGLCFYDSSSKKLNLFNSVDWVMRNLHARPDYQGLGYIELGLDISDPEAIQKVQDGRYLTVSVGFGTDAAICSVCHTDWAEDDRCDHELGHQYDGKPCFLISGNFVYKEVSMVNFPADPWGTITGTDSIQQIAASVDNRIFFMGLSQAEQQKRFVVDGKLALDFTDSIDFLGSDIQIGQEPAEDIDMDVKAIQDEIRSKDLTKERALELRTELDSVEDKASVKRLVTSLNAKIRANGWNEQAGPSKADIEAKIAGLDAHLATLSADERTVYVTELQDQAAAFGLVLPEAKPVEDAAAAPAAAEPAAASANTDAAAGPEQWLVDLVNTELDTDEKKEKIDGKGAVSALDVLHKFYHAIPDEDKYIFRSAVSALLEHWYSGSNLQYYKNRLIEQGSDAVIAKSELDELHAAIEKYEADVQSLETDKQALIATNKQVLKDQKDTLARILVTGSILLQKPGFTGLSTDQIQTEISEKSGRKLNSLQDSLSDLLKELPNAEIKPAASEPKPNEGSVRQVEDTAKVEENADPQAQAAEGADEVADSGEKRIVIATRILGPKELARRAAAARFDARQKK